MGKRFSLGKRSAALLTDIGAFITVRFCLGTGAGGFFAGLGGGFAVRRGCFGDERVPAGAEAAERFRRDAKVPGARDSGGAKCGTGKFQAGRMAQRFEASFRWDGMWVALDGRILAGRWELRQNGLAGNWDRERVKKRWLKEISGFGEIRAGGTAQEGLTVFLGGKGDIRQAVFWCRQALNGVLAVCRKWSGRTVSAGVTQKKFLPEMENEKSADGEETE